MKQATLTLAKGKNSALEIIEKFFEKFKFEIWTVIVISRLRFIKCKRGYHLSFALTYCALAEHRLRRSGIWLMHSSQCVMANAQDPQCVMANA